MGNLNPSYDKDFYAWAMENAELLRKKRFEDIDIENVAEEIESMGKREKRALISHLAVLMAHLLKLQHKEKHVKKKYEEGQSTTSWKSSIKNARRELLKLLKDSPSLRNHLELNLNEAYEDGVIKACDDTGMVEYDFPKQCPFSLNDCLDENFFPD
jgi:hypothetical protein